MAPMEHARANKLLEQSKVGPAISPDRTTLPLTFLDISLAGPIYVRRQFFYQFPYPAHHFIRTTLPSLKHSLSVALQNFFPLAGNLLCPPPPHKPYIRCTSDDSVSLTVVESASDDFNHYSANYPKNLEDLECLVPKLSWSTVDEDINGADSTFVFPIVALQVTVFPNVGFCIAITYCHVMDDNCCSHFMKTWASICRSDGRDMTFLDTSTPSYDREVIKDPRGLETVFLRDYFKERSVWKESLVGKTSKHVVNNDDDLFKATIVFCREDIEVLRKVAIYQWKKNGESNAPKYLSKFAVTCGFVWASLVKTRYGDENEEEKDEYFRFAADCRNRLEDPLQENYFGNCITRCYASLKRKELKGEEGFLKAVKAIVGAIEDMKKEPFKDAEKWKENFKKMFVLGSTVLVTGSPKFTVYETDFGFGRPKKVEMVHSFKCMSLAESGSEEGGGLEVGLVFRKHEHEDFMCVVERGLQTFKA
ncbi:coumaroyl-CoA:anthocyanidin 3-O-glucoside-6''-O-coumaroyltransferase 2-like [Neltuma alba]|uniref:coumaroyl-CoA:anthocyanidin 3-O-glucoside-6''-O-coumaroyltransferase 2-like n=1 Tax=Neltuma alba TaxID=207710 RepID=UPI0010A5647D|nr:coumaroyl-CoA:anthocyanidin 3-O-glucoside-6''-O-coumaroyltransferase 2-like [Prosopis alba]XP_028808482.1 coumaroyl-CoA:anthocyanidin 3-O-glucoside-6''-O-coumaroyltransferase 2-like [Prosopis alba]